MIYSISGIVESLDDFLVVATSGGISFQIKASATLRRSAIIGSSLTVLCLLYPETYDLYGFFDVSEKKLFELLVSVSGVGPSTALKVLDGMPYADILSAIVQNKDEVLARCCGVSSRTASRIVVELRGKLHGLSFDYGASDVMNDAVSALQGLGYRHKDIAHVLSQPSVRGKTSEEIIKKALKLLSRP